MLIISWPQQALTTVPKAVKPLTIFFQKKIWINYLIPPPTLWLHLLCSLLLIRVYRACRFSTFCEVYHRHFLMHCIPTRQTTGSREERANKKLEGATQPMLALPQIGYAAIWAATAGAS